MPDKIRSCGDWIAPALEITSLKRSKWRRVVKHYLRARGMWRSAAQIKENTVAIVWVYFEVLPAAVVAFKMDPCELSRVASSGLMVKGIKGL